MKPSECARASDVTIPCPDGLPCEAMPGFGLVMVSVIVATPLRKDPTSIPIKNVQNERHALTNPQ
jgi:hypothetical protein